MEERKKEKTGKLHRTAKAQHRGRSLQQHKKCDLIYTHTHICIYTHKQSQKSPTKVKYNRLTQQTKKTKNYIYQNKAN